MHSPRTTRQQRELKLWKLVTGKLSSHAHYIIFYGYSNRNNFLFGFYFFCSGGEAFALSLSLSPHFLSQFSIPDVTFSFLRGNLCLFLFLPRKKRGKKITEGSFSAAPVRFLFSQYDKFKALRLLFLYHKFTIFHSQKPNSSLVSRSPRSPSPQPFIIFHAHTFRAFMLNPRLIYIVNAVIN